jgi:hypothetical protein
MSFSELSSLDGKSWLPRPSAGAAGQTPELGRHYNPDEPRISAGQHGGGEWTRMDDSGREIASDEASELRADAQYAQGPPRGRGVGLRPIPSQLESFRLDLANIREQLATAQIRQRDQLWTVTPSVTAPTIEGRIAEAEGRAREAEDYLRELIRYGIGPGRFACVSIPARGSARDATPGERYLNDRNGYTFGCHTCGTRDPGTGTGSFVLDHQIPIRMNLSDLAQRLFPQCIACSRAQGLWITRWLRRNGL